MPVLIVGKRCLHMADVRRGGAAASAPEDWMQREWCARTEQAMYAL